MRFPAGVVFGVLDTVHCALLVPFVIGPVSVFVVVFHISLGSPLSGVVFVSGFLSSGFGSSFFGFSIGRCHAHPIAPVSPTTSARLPVLILYSGSSAVTGIQGVHETDIVPGSSAIQGFVQSP